MCLTTIYNCHFQKKNWLILIPKYTVTQVDGSVPRILPELPGSLVYFSEFPPFPVRNRTEPAGKYTRKMEAVFPLEFTVPGTGGVPQIPPTGTKRSAAVSARIITGWSTYPTGNDRKQQRNPPETPGSHNLSHQKDFSMDFLCISIGFSHGFRVYFNRISTGISERFQ
jgi:hypothetical protein